MAEVQTCLAEFAAAPGALSAHLHLVDFAEITSYAQDVVGILETQARLAEVFAGDPRQWLFAYYTPTSVGRSLANYGVRAWSNVAGVSIRLAETEAAALDILGLAERRLADLLGDAVPQ